MKKILLASIMLSVGVFASTNVLVKANLLNGFIFAVNEGNLNPQRAIVSFEYNNMKCTAVGTSSLEDSNRASIRLHDANCDNTKYDIQSSFFDKEKIVGIKGKPIGYSTTKDNVLKAPLFRFDAQEGYISLYSLKLSQGKI